jgi:hypothetical protein
MPQLLLAVWNLSESPSLKANNDSVMPILYALMRSAAVLYIPVMISDAVKRKKRGEVRGGEVASGRR